jgi:branched-chain amino acid transport system ATP-binding protein
MTTVLEVRHLHKSFGNIVAIKDMSIGVGEGEILGIIGPNGAGKTTLFNLVMGVCAQDGGEVLLMGRNIDGLKTFERVNRGIARTFQFARNFPHTTVLEHIRMAMLSAKHRDHVRMHRDMRSQAEHIARVVRLEGLLDKLPGQLNIEELRKLELAMAMAVAPTILLIDEMFAGLTEEEADQITRIIRAMIEQQAPSTIVVIDHNLSALAGIANRIVAMDLGSKITEGSFDEVCANEEVKKAYLGEYVR